MRIVLFKRTNCQYCKLAKKLLDQNKISYNVIQIDDGVEELAEYNYYAMTHRLPLILVNLPEENIDVYVPHEQEIFEGSGNITKAIEFIKARSK